MAPVPRNETLAFLSYMCRNCGDKRFGAMASEDWLRQHEDQRIPCSGCHGTIPRSAVRAQLELMCDGLVDRDEQSSPSDRTETID